MVPTQHERIIVQYIQHLQCNMYVDIILMYDMRHDAHASSIKHPFMVNLDLYYLIDELASYCLLQLMLYYAATLYSKECSTLS